MDIKQLIHTLQHTHQLQPEQMQTLLTAAFSDAVIRAELAQAAQQTAQAVFGNKIYIRGLIEFTNYCRNDCYYCGIRRSNTEAVRYRLTEEQILSCCEQGYALGFRTFVLQGGEDLIYSDTDLAAIISAIKQAYPDCAVTLSITMANLLEDLAFIRELQPQMIGIGPFIPHHATPFKNYPAGTLEQTLTLLSVLRLMFPKVLLPATTALGTIVPNGRELGILAGANVVMPNLSPADVRQNYLLYDNKLCSGAEAAEAKNDLAARLHSIGYEIAEGRGDYKES